jgi:hypothetical protein
MTFPVIFTNTRGMYSRTELKHFVQVLSVQICCHGYNPRAIADLYDTIEHHDMTRDSSSERIIVMPPQEVREKCDKIARGRKNRRQNELEVETCIMNWCAENNVTAKHAVYTNKPAILFFDNASTLVMAKLAMDEYICDLEKRCWDAV